MKMIDKRYSFHLNLIFLSVKGGRTDTFYVRDNAQTVKKTKTKPNNKTTFSNIIYIHKTIKEMKSYSFTSHFKVIN